MAFNFNGLYASDFTRFFNRAKAEKSTNSAKSLVTASRLGFGVPKIKLKEALKKIGNPNFFVREGKVYKITE